MGRNSYKVSNGKFEGFEWLESYIQSLYNKKQRIHMPMFKSFLFQDIHKLTKGQKSHLKPTFTPKISTLHLDKTNSLIKVALHPSSRKSTQFENKNKTKVTPYKKIVV